jgi:diacylglycerol kinase family enzyme
MYQAIRAQNHLQMPQVRCVRGREIHLDARRPTRVHVDDRARKRTPVDIRVVPEALSVIVDRL